MAMLAKMRGVTSLRIGSTPRARMASICSVTTMEPSSLAMEDALRPATMIPVSTAPSSRIMVRRDELTCNRRGAELRERGRGLKRKHAAGKEAGKDDDGQRTDADNVGLSEKVGPIDRRAKKVEKGAQREQGIFLDGKHDLSGGTVDRIYRHEYDGLAIEDHAALQRTG